MRCSLSRIATFSMLVLLFLRLAAGQAPSPEVSGPEQRRQTPTLDEKLQATVPDFNASGRAMVDLVLGLAYRYELPMALEYATSEAVRRPLDLRLRSQSLKEVIAAIVRAVPGYRVDFSGGLVDIYSPSARFDPSNPFNTTVRQFDVRDMDTHLADAQLLCSVGRQLNPHSGGCGGSVAGGQWGDLKITLHMQNKKVYEILNAIVAQNGWAAWTQIAPLTKPARLGPNIATNFWYIYPLDRHFESTAVERLEALFPPSTPNRPH